MALRDLGGGRCEMKRLYLAQAARGSGVGRALIAKVVQEARAIGYAEMVLDTLPSMVRAQRLYEAAGFVETSAYRHNPVPGARYLAKRLEPP